MDEIRISRQGARRFLVRAFALDGHQTLPDVRTALDRLICVQMDSIHVCGRMHDLILRPRVQNYAPQLLHDELYRDRRAFEYYFPNLSVLPVAMYPYFVRSMQARRATPGRWQGLLDDEIAVAASLLATIDDDGPFRARASDTAHGYTQSGWGTRMKVASHVLEKLWLNGTLSTAHRVNFERYFDRTERLYPDLWAHHQLESALPDPDETVRYLARQRLRMRRIFRLNADAKRLATEIVRVRIEGVRRDWFALAEDVPALVDADSLPLPDTMHLLAPLDPLVYDRVRLMDLWDFEYTWEVYVPQAKRRWGYYVLPVLLGEQLVARIDLKAQREAKRLEVRNLLWQKEDRTAQRERLLGDALQAFAHWNECDKLSYTNPAATFAGSSLPCEVSEPRRTETNENEN